MLSSKTSIALMRPTLRSTKYQFPGKGNLRVLIFHFKIPSLKPQALRGILLACVNKSHSVAEGGVGPACNSPPCLFPALLSSAAVYGMCLIKPCFLPAQLSRWN